MGTSTKYNFDSVTIGGSGSSGKRTSLALDRSIEPAKDAVPEITLPDVWSHTYANGLRIYGVEHTELPLVQISLTLRGGMLLDDPSKVGVANLMTDILMEGTENIGRQGVDNRPYGHTNFVIHKLLYPEGHPYNWQVIGSLEDLQRATVDDVRAFFRKWYGPNNVTLVVAGDFGFAQTREWIEKYFGDAEEGYLEIR